MRGRWGFLAVFLVASALHSPVAQAGRPATATKDRQVIRFFLHHPRLAHTRAGELALWTVLGHVEVRLRTLQAARAVPLTNEQEARKAIVAVFGSYADQAMRVAGCETGQTYDPRAANGQYLGIFQMGTTERATYGDGPSWLEQAQAAHRYFLASGSDWSPWQCGWAAR